MTSPRYVVTGTSSKGGRVSRTFTDLGVARDFAAARNRAGARVRVVGFIPARRAGGVAH